MEKSKIEVLFLAVRLCVCVKRITTLFHKKKTLKLMNEGSIKSLLGWGSIKSFTRESFKNHD